MRRLALLSAVLTAGVMFMSSASAQNTPAHPNWVQVTEHAAFCPRDTAEDAVFAGKMWISNAYQAGGGLIRDLWSSSDGVNWTEALREAPYDGYAEFVVFEDRLWAIKSSVWNSPDGVAWTKVLDRTPFGTRGYGECVVFDGKIWQLGSGKDVWNTRDGVNWECVTAEAPFGNRWASAVAVYDGKLWLCGGCIQVPSDPPEKHYPKFTTYNDVWCSSDGANWTRVLEHAPWAERMWFIAREYAGKLWILGGFSNRESKNLAECWTTTDGVKWEEYKSDPMWSPRHEPTIYVYEDSLWLAAGNMWPLMNDVWRLTLP